MCYFRICYFRICYARICYVIRISHARISHARIRLSHGARDMCVGIPTEWDVHWLGWVGHGRLQGWGRGCDGRGIGCGALTQALTQAAEERASNERTHEVTVDRRAVWRGCSEDQLGAIAHAQLATRGRV